MDTVLTLITGGGNLVSQVPGKTCDVPVLQRGLLTCPSAPGPLCFLPFLVEEVYVY